jgi:hypothetical protein
MGKIFRISSYIRKPFLIYEFPYIRGKFCFLFYQCRHRYSGIRVQSGTAGHGLFRHCSALVLEQLVLSQECVLQQPMLSLDESVLQHTVLPHQEEFG